MFKDDTVITILETAKQKELRALGEIAKERTYWQYERLRRQKEQDFVWDFLRQVKACLPTPSGGALFVNGSTRVPGALPEDLQIWPAADGTPRY